MKLSPTPPGLAHLVTKLEELEAQHRLRGRFPAFQGASGEPVSFCSNDYLGLAARGAPQVAAGSAASRLVSGDHEAHRNLELALTEWLQAPAALTFTSGYAANVGIVAALAERGDLVVSDALNHASLIDGARLSRARVQVVPHCDVNAVRAALAAPRAGRAFVVTESYFSMDADGPDLRALRAACDEGGAALVVDEAHAVGVFGEDGRGLCAAAGVTPDVLIGTFGKSFGAAGAFVVGCEALILWLWNRARSFVFSTGMSPAVAAAAHANLALSLTRPEMRAATLANAEALRSGLRELGLSPLGFGHIIPCVVGSEEAALARAAALRVRGFHAQAIRPPTVPAGTSRLRVTATAAQSPGDIRGFLRAVADFESLAPPRP